MTPPVSPEMPSPALRGFFVGSTRYWWRAAAAAVPRQDRGPFVQARFILDVFKELRQVVRYILPVAQAAGMANACLQRDYSPLEAPYLPS